jgi:glycosyltransferase involved in cell wall biosynthesis
LDHPLFSIIIPTYNRASLLPRAINSVLNQIYANWELLIIDDGSTDQTEKKVKAIVDQRIRYFYKEHEERSIARNYGIERAKGRYLCFLDSDDYFLEDHLEKHFNYLNESGNPEIVLYSGTWVEESGKRWKYPHLGTSDNVIRSLWFTGYNLLPFSFPKNLIGDLRFDAQLNFMEDLDFLLKIFKSIKLEMIEERTQVVVSHDERSIELRFKQHILKMGKENLKSIDLIMERHHVLLKNYMKDSEIILKRKKLARAFLASASKQLEIKSILYFGKELIFF